MKYTKLALACGLAFAAMSVQAVPVPNAAAVPESNIVFMAGASAPDNFLQTVATSMFQPGFIQVRGISETNNFRAFVGTSASASTGFPVGTPMIFIKRSLGGSVWGVSPVATGDIIQTLDVKSANCVAPVAPNTFWTCPVIGTDPQGNNNGANGRVPDMGISDIEPAMFKQPFNTENNAPQLTNAQIAALVSQPTNQLMMGIVATNSVAPSTTISRSQYGAALAGKLTNWQQIDGTTSNMVVCRRVNGSGTQTAYNWFFSGFPCNLSTSGFSNNSPVGVGASRSVLTAGRAGTLADPFIVNPAAGLTIIENSSSGDVRSCLSSAYYGLDHNVQANSGTFYRVTFSSVTGTPVAATPVAVGTAPAVFTGTRGGPSKAIGTLSIDSSPNLITAFRHVQRNPAASNAVIGSYDFTDNSAGNTLSASGWSFRMLDGAGVFNTETQLSVGAVTGIAPSKANLLSGKYDFVVELTMNRRSSLVANKVSFFNELRRRLGEPQFNTNIAFAALPDLYSYVDNPNTVSVYSRAGNTCSPLVRFPNLVVEE